MENVTRTTYVEFIYPGVMSDESGAEVVLNRNVDNLEVPRGAFAFRFFDVLSITVQVDGDTVQLASENLNVSPKHYYGGRIMTLEDIRIEVPNPQILISNMRSIGVDRVIKTRHGNFQPVYDSDILLEEKS